MSGNTNEIRTDVNAILDCVDYVCQRLDISQEELDKAYDFIKNEILTPGIKEGISNALFGEKKRRPYTEYKRVDYSRASLRHDSPKKPHTAKDDWSYELDHLYFDTITEAKRIKDSITTRVETYGTVAVSDVYELMDETPPFPTQHYGWNYMDIFGKIKIEPICGGAQVILPPPVRLKV